MSGTMNASKPVRQAIRFKLNGRTREADVASHENVVDLLMRLGVAAVLGLLLGLDRELHDKAAGLRTHGLICFSTAAMTISIIALYHQFDTERTDVLRIYEATGAFIGIIGAGLIVFSKGRLHNLTTAAHLWLTAMIGIACGAGQWPLVLIGAVISILMLTLLGLVERRYFPDEDYTE